MGTEPPEGEGWERDPDVLDTWFSSGLWPFATLGWPEDTPELRAFHPTDVLSTARDILFLWVARMVMLGLRFTGEIPFADVYIHSVIQAPDGRRMSKSLGTGVDPLALIDGGPRPRLRPGRDFPAYGADAVRFGLLAMSSSQDVRFSEEKIAQGQALVNKLFNATRFALLQIGDEDVAPEPRVGADGTSRTVGSSRGSTRRRTRCATRIDDFDFAKAALGLYDYIYGDLCDWYLEMVKPRLYAEDDPAARGARRHAAPRPARDAHARAPDHPVRHRGAVGMLPGEDGLLAATLARAATRPRAIPRPRSRWAARSPR